jgi:hypothetical protein
MAPFEFSVTIPAEQALAAMIRDVVAHGARQAGAPDDKALEFGCRVEDGVRDLAVAAADQPVTCVIRLGGVSPGVSPGAPLHVAITGGAVQRTFSLDI